MLSFVALFFYYLHVTECICLKLSEFCNVGTFKLKSKSFNCFFFYYHKSSMLCNLTQLILHQNNILSFNKMKWKVNFSSGRSCIMHHLIANGQPEHSFPNSAVSFHLPSAFDILISSVYFSSSSYPNLFFIFS